MPPYPSLLAFGGLVEKMVLTIFWLEFGKCVSPLWFFIWWDGRWLWNGLGLMSWKMGKACPNSRRTSCRGGRKKDSSESANLSVSLCSFWKDVIHQKSSLHLRWVPALAEEHAEIPLVGLALQTVQTVQVECWSRHASSKSVSRGSGPQLFGLQNKPGVRVTLVLPCRSKKPFGRMFFRVKMKNRHKMHRMFKFLCLGVYFQQAGGTTPETKCKWNYWHRSPVPA